MVSVLGVLQRNFPSVALSSTPTTRAAPEPKERTRVKAGLVYFHGLLLICLEMSNRARQENAGKVTVSALELASSFGATL